MVLVATPNQASPGRRRACSTSTIENESIALIQCHSYCLHGQESSISFLSQLFCWSSSRIGDVVLKSGIISTAKKLQRGTDAIHYFHGGQNLCCWLTFALCLLPFFLTFYFMKIIYMQVSLRDKFTFTQSNKRLLRTNTLHQQFYLM